MQRMHQNKTLTISALRAVMVVALATGTFGTTVCSASPSPGTYSAAAPQSKITGTVVDENGDPMIGVTVKVRGTATGVITDVNGSFTITAEVGKQLELSYVGYETLVVKATSKPMTLKLSPDAKLMDEVVVIGYGSVKKRDMLGAISSVKSEEITQSPTMNAMEGLQGKIAGLDITRESGAAGSTPTVLLRGQRSIDGNNAPLYVIDGITGGDISNLNTNDIESMEVLKDASSTAIYGSAGANGVIIITTKQGTKGRVQIDFNAYVGLNCMPAYPETYQGKAWVDYMRTGLEAYYGKTLQDIYPEATGDAELQDRLFNAYGLSPEAIDCYNTGKFINWKDAILQTGIEQNYSLSVRGGGEKVSSYMSAGYQDEQGMYRNDRYNKLTFRAGTTYDANKLITLGFNLDVTHKNQDKRNSRLSKTLNAVPLGEVYNEDGTLKRNPTGNVTDYVNIMADDLPFAYLNNSKSTKLGITPFIEIKPLKGLSFKSIINTSVSTSRSGEYEGLDTYYKLTGSSQDVGIRTANKRHNDSWSIEWQNILNYNLKIKDAHDIGATLIMQWNEGTSESSYLGNRGFDFDSYTWNALNAGSQASVNSSYSNKKSLSYAGRLTYSFLGRYLFSATMRWDGSSVLYDKWDSFPSVSVGWRISDEPFMKPTQGWLDNLKLRAGYGITGNSNVPAYSSKTLIEALGENLNLGGGSVTEYILKQEVANYALSWEKSYNWNIGLDFGFLNGRIDGSIEYYTTDTKGVLYKRQLPTVYGLYNAKAPYTLMSNVARIKNKGVELTINTRNIRTRDFDWNTTFTFAKNDEKLHSINLGNGTSVDELVSLGLFIDNPVVTYYGYKKLGIWQLGEEDKAICFGLYPGQVRIDTPNLKWDPDYEYEGIVTTDRITNEKAAVKRHGAYYTEDADGVRTYYRGGSPVYDENGKITGETGANYYSPQARDKQILGHKQPDFTIGLNNSFRIFDFDLSIHAVMRWGQMVNGDLLGYPNATNQPECFDYWTPTNPTNAFPLAQLGVSNEAKSALQYVDGSFIKIKNITVGYNVPKSLLSKINLSKLRIYSTIYNPFIWAKNDMLKGLDPENTSSSFPLYKTVVIGVNVSF